MSPPASRAQELLDEAMAAEASGQRALLDGDGEAARRDLARAAEAYRGSWEAAGPRSFGRLVGMLKATVLAGAGDDVASAAAYAREQLAEPPDSPTSAYAAALAALLAGADDEAAEHVVVMREGGEAFARTADALAALASGDRDAYASALDAILADFAARPEHLTGVRIADTAAMLERLAEPRGLAVRPASELLPGAGSG